MKSVLLRSTRLTWGAVGGFDSAHILIHAALGLGLVGELLGLLFVDAGAVLNRVVGDVLFKLTRDSHVVDLYPSVSHGK